MIYASECATDRFVCELIFMPSPGKTDSNTQCIPLLYILLARKVVQL